MKIYFSPEYTGHTYIDWDTHSDLLWDATVLDLTGLISLLEMHLGIFTPPETRAVRIAHYHEALSRYIEAHPNCIFAPSFRIDGLSVAEVCLSQRDQLSLAGWCRTAPPCDSERLSALQDIEEYFSSRGLGERLAAVLQRLRGSSLCTDLQMEIELPVSRELLPPWIKQLLDLMEGEGAVVQEEEAKEAAGESNLTRLQHFLRSADRSLTLSEDKGDRSVEILQFDDEATAVEYLLSEWPDGDELVINSGNKLFDNFLSQQQRPRSGSVISDGVPQVAQLFILGLRTLLRPLDLQYLLQWCYAPVSPLQGKFRYSLARQIASSGGYYADEVQTFIESYLNGEYDSDDEKSLSPQKRSSLRRKREDAINAFLPPRDIGLSDKPLTKGQLSSFITAYIDWATVRIQLLATEGDLQTAQLLTETLSQAEAMRIVIRSVSDGEEVQSSKLQNWTANLYHNVDIVQYEAERGSTEVISSPAQMLSPSRKTTWVSFYGDEGSRSPFAWLTRSERKALEANGVTLWSDEDARSYYHQLSYRAILRTTEALRLILIGYKAGVALPKHPIHIRLEQTISNWADLITRPTLVRDYPLTPTTVDNRLNGTEPEVMISNSGRIHFPDKESVTSMESLILHPMDYTLENLVGITGISLNQPNEIRRVKGNVAHGVISGLCYESDKAVISAQELTHRIDTSFDRLFDEVILSHGAILLLPENQLECKFLKVDLRRCLKSLTEILKMNNLHIVASERAYSMDSVYQEDLHINGRVDMLLSNDRDELIVIDFKWSDSGHYYSSLLEQNISLQLSVYSDLVSRDTGKSVLGTGYFLMPGGRLYTTLNLRGAYVIAALSADSNSAKIANSYAFRRKQILDGNIETDLSNTPANLLYGKALEDKNLFPLTAALENDDNVMVKRPALFSPYTMIAK